MAGFLSDTSCLVAAVCAWREHHHRAGEELGRAMGFATPHSLPLRADQVLQ